MGNIDTSAAQRLRETISYARMTAKQFAKEIGVSQPGISNVLTGRNKSITSEIGEKITILIPQINPEWLLWGRGEMLRSHISEKKYAGPEDVVRVLGESGEVYETWAAGVERRLGELEEAVARLKG